MFLIQKKIEKGLFIAVAIAIINIGILHAANPIGGEKKPPVHLSFLKARQHIHIRLRKRYLRFWTASTVTAIVRNTQAIRAFYHATLINMLLFAMCDKMRQ